MLTPKKHSIKLLRFLCYCQTGRPSLQHAPNYAPHPHVQGHTHLPCESVEVTIFWGELVSHLVQCDWHMGRRGSGVDCHQSKPCVMWYGI